MNINGIVSFAIKIEPVHRSCFSTCAYKDGREIYLSQFLNSEMAISYLYYVIQFLFGMVGSTLTGAFSI